MKRHFATLLVLSFVIANLFAVLSLAISNNINATTFFNSKEAILNYSGSTTLKVTNAGKLDSINLSVYYPVNCSSQRVLSYKFDIKPRGRVIFVNNSPIILFEKPTNDLSVSYYFIVDRKVKPRIKESLSLPQFYKVIDYNHNILNFTQKTSRYDYNPKITSLASSIVEGSPDEFVAVSKIITWVHNYMTYDLSMKGKVPNATQILKTHKGVCTEYSTLSMALLRSINIPSREVSGFVYSNLNSVKGFAPHSWIEVYFPNYGWVSFDPTYLEFGYVDASHITLTGKHLLSWRGENVEIEQNKVLQHVNVLLYKSELNKPGITIHFFKDSEGINSCNVVYATITNNADYYDTECFNISVNNKLKLMSNDTYKCVFLPPHSSRNISWIVSTINLDKMYSYTLPILIYNNKLSKEASFYAAVTSANIPFSSCISFEHSLRDTLSFVVENFSIVCNPKFIYPHNKNISCKIRNIGNVPVRNLRVCSQTKCYNTNINIHELKEFSFPIVPNGERYNFYLNLTSNNKTLNYEKIFSVLKEVNYSVTINLLNSSTGYYTFNVNIITKCTRNK